MKTKTEVWLAIICLLFTLVVVPLFSTPSKSKINKPVKPQNLLLYNGIKLNPSDSNAQFNITGYFTVNSLDVKSENISFENDVFEVVTEDDNCYVNLNSWGWDDKEFTAYCKDANESVSFKIGGFNPNTDYKILVDGSEFKNTTTNRKGEIDFTYNSWSNHTFTINDDNDSPSVKNPTPQDGYTLTNFKPILKVDVSDPESDKMEISFYNAKTDKLIGTDEVDGSGTAEIKWIDANSENYDYKWYAVINDGSDRVKSDTWQFDINQTKYIDYIKSIFFTIVPLIIITIAIITVVKVFGGFSSEI